MTSDRIESVWSSSSNRLRSVEIGSLTTAFIDELKARRTRFLLGVATVGVAFATVTVLTAVLLVSQKDLQAHIVWTLLPLNVLMWGGWLAAIAGHLRGPRLPETAGVPIREALQHAFAQRQMHLSRLRLIAGGLLVSTPFVAFSIHQMVETGRLSPEGLPRQIALALGAYGVAFACLGSDYFGQSTREVERLRSLSNDCERGEESLSDGSPQQETRDEAR